MPSPLGEGQADMPIIRLHLGEVPTPFLIPHAKHPLPSVNP
jgi:hypothetical protein